MKRWSGIACLMFIMVCLLSAAPALADIVTIPDNLVFNPRPQPGDTVVSGTCSQLQGCTGLIGIFLINGDIPDGEAPGREFGIQLGYGTCINGVFSVTLCHPIPNQISLPCTLYALQSGDIIRAIQLDEFSNPCDSTPEFTVGLAVPILNELGMLLLGLSLALSALYLLRKKRLEQRKA
jgi:hypothetical protein